MYIINSNACALTVIELKVETGYVSNGFAYLQNIYKIPRDFYV